MASLKGIPELHPRWEICQEPYVLNPFCGNLGDHLVSRVQLKYKILDFITTETMCSASDILLLNTIYFEKFLYKY